MDALPEVGAALDAAVPPPGAEVPGARAPNAEEPNAEEPGATAPGATARGVVARGVVARGIVALGVPALGVPAPELEAEAGVTLAAAGLAGPSAFVGVEDAPVLGAGLAPTPPAGFVVADDSGAPGFAGCFAAAGVADDAPVPALRVVVSRDGVPEPPTVALPTVALPTAADARAGLLEF